MKFSKMRFSMHNLTWNRGKEASIGLLLSLPVRGMGHDDIVWKNNKKHSNYHDTFCLYKWSRIQGRKSPRILFRNSALSLWVRIVLKIFSTVYPMLMICFLLCFGVLTHTCGSWILTVTFLVGGIFFFVRDPYESKLYQRSPLECIQS